MKLHQLLRMISISSPVAIIDSQGITINKVLSKIEIDLDLYEYNVLSIGAALATFSETKPCIYIIIEK